MIQYLGIIEQRTNLLLLLQAYVNSLKVSLDGYRLKNRLFTDMSNLGK